MAGQTDKAFEWLEKGYEEREGQDLTLLKFDPSFKNLRSDPRFPEILRKIGLPQLQSKSQTWKLSSGTSREPPATRILTRLAISITM